MKAVQRSRVNLHTIGDPVFLQYDAPEGEAPAGATAFIVHNVAVTNEHSIEVWHELSKLASDGLPPTLEPHRDMVQQLVAIAASRELRI